MTTAIGAYATLALLRARLSLQTADTGDDTVLTSICDQVNQYIETQTGRVLAPVGSATYLFNGDNTIYLAYPKGIRAVSLLEIAGYTGASYETVPSTDYFLEPVQPRTGWPYTRIEFGDNPTGTYSWFPFGKRTVRVTMTTGWAAIPDDVTELALTAATKAWHAVEAGQADIVGTDEMGRPLVSRFFSGRDLGTLKTYTADTGIG